MPVMTVVPWSRLFPSDHIPGTPPGPGDALVVDGGAPLCLLAEGDDESGFRLDQAVTVDGKPHMPGTPLRVTRSLHLAGEGLFAAIALGDTEIGLCWPEHAGPAAGRLLTIDGEGPAPETGEACARQGLAGFTGVLCFATGTRIATPAGPRRVETLRPGELVETVGGAPQAVIWSGRREVLFDKGEDARRPVLFRPGSLGPDTPERDLVVSPGHRILLRGPALRRLCGAEEALAPAHALTDLRGARPMHGKRRVTYVHIMLKHHAVILSEGAGSETFYPDPEAVAALTDAQRAAVFALVPALREAPETGYGPTARPVLGTEEARALSRHLKARGLPACPAPEDAARLHAAG